MQDSEIRLNKYIATNYGVSRREADDLIAAGKVSVNGNTTGIGARVKTTDVVTVDGHDIVMFAAEKRKATHQRFMSFYQRNIRI